MPPKLSAKTAYKKVPGLLELSQTHLQWTPSGKPTPVLRILTAKAASLFCSKEGSAQVKLKLGLSDDEAGHTFLFISPQASSEREAFKKELTNIIGANRAVQAVTPSAPPTAGPSTPSIHAPRTQPGATPIRASDSRAASVASSGRDSPVTVAAPEDFAVRKKVLMRNPNLASLHRELVMTGQISETEFWEGREYLLQAETAQDNQKRGRPGQMVDPKPETVEGDIKIRVTPQLVHDIFEQYPVVARAYNENVPKELSEAAFWQRYFQSKLFVRHQASIRSTATQHYVKDDPIFDNYLEKEDDELEPRKQRDEEVDLIVNLLATQEDHKETGNLKDTTMQAGRQRGALPLIRKFNEHSERLLNAAEGSNKRRRIENPYAEIEFDDLQGDVDSSGILLEMKDRERYFNGGPGQTRRNEDKPDFRKILPLIRRQADDWSTPLSSLRIEKKASDAALQSMTQNVQARLEVKMQKDDIPEGLYSQMQSCHTAANEFLRQFWSSIFPPPSDGNVLTALSAVQRATKAAKMAGYLVKFPEKIDAIVQSAEQAGVDAGKIETAMKPVLDAVKKAVQFHRAQLAKGAK